MSAHEPVKLVKRSPESSAAYWKEKFEIAIGERNTFLADNRKLEDINQELRERNEKLEEALDKIEKIAGSYETDWIDIIEIVRGVRGGKAESKNLQSLRKP